MKKNISIFLNGGIGGGYKNQGVPTMVQIIMRLSELYSIDVYSHAFVNKKTENIKFHFAPKWISISIFRWMYLMVSFIKNHIGKCCDLVFSFWGYPSGLVATLLGKIINKPSLVILLGGETANLPEISYGLMRNRFTRKMVLWTCRNATQLITMTNYQFDHLKKYGVTRDVKIIPWGADLKIFQRTEKELSTPLKFIHVANLNQVKDQKTLLLTFDLIRKKINAQLKIIGHDALAGEIQEYSSKLGLSSHVTFLDSMMHHEIAHHLADADCFLLTSLSEGQSTAATEAMACGLLAASTNVGIMADLGIDYGVVVKEKDHKAMANEIILLYSNQTEWKRKIENSCRWATTHDFNWTMAQLVKEINQL